MKGPGMPRALALAAGVLIAACTPDALGPPSNEPTAAFALSAKSDPSAALESSITARRNLHVILRGPGAPEGEIRFRQPEDDEFIAFLDTRVNGLAPHTDYQLQRAVDATVDDVCTSTDWLTLGQLDQPLVLQTNGQGHARAEFSRDLSVAAGGQFDIRFRVVVAGTTAVVLRSGCYQFKVRQ